MKEEREYFIELGFDKEVINKMSDDEIEKMCSYKDCDDMQKFYEKMMEKFEEEREDKND